MHFYRYQPVLVSLFLTFCLVFAFYQVQIREESLIGKIIRESTPFVVLLPAIVHYLIIKINEDIIRVDGGWKLFKSLLSFPFLLLFLGGAMYFFGVIFLLLLQGVLNLTYVPLFNSSKFYFADDFASYLGGSVSVILYLVYFFLGAFFSFGELSKENTLSSSVGKRKFGMGFGFDFAIMLLINVVTSYLLYENISFYYKGDAALNDLLELSIAMGVLLISTAVQVSVSFLTLNHILKNLK